MAYSDKVMDHFSNPRNMGEIPDADGVGMVGNPVCGDAMKIMIKVNNETEIIDDIKFKTFGCAAAIATSSMLTELIKDKNVTVDGAMEITNKRVADALGGLPKEKVHCSVLAEEGIQSAIADYNKKKEGSKK